MDREKVVNGLYWVINDIEENGHYQIEYYAEKIRDALALLKEREPVEPDTDSEGTCSCGNCDETVGYYPVGCNTPQKFCKFCPECGKPVKWE